MKHVCQYCFHPVDEHHAECPYTEDRPYPGTMTGKLGIYKWPGGDDVAVVILSKPDENGDVGIYVLPENRRVPVVDVRPFTETEEN